MKRMLGILVTCMCLWSASCYSQEGITIAHGVVGKDYPPYYMAYPDRTEGLCPEIIEAVASKINLHISYVQYPWSRSLMKVENGEVDAIFPIFKTPERSEFLYFFNNILAYEENAFFTLRENPMTFSGNLEEMRSYTIGSVQDYSYGEYFDTYPLLKKYETTNEGILINMLLARRFDMLIGNTLVIPYKAKRQGVSDRLKLLGPSISKDPVYLAFSKATVSEELAQRFSRALAEFKRTSQYWQILTRYGL